MTKTLAFVFAVALSAPLSAGEHPEHPTGAEHPSPKAAAKSEHPKGKEHPAGHEHPVGSKEWTKQMSKEYTKAVEGHVAKAPEGFKVMDGKLGKEWTLKLIGVHKKRVAHLGDKKFFACADFKSTNTKDKLDLDFYASKTGDAWVIDQVLIHKVNGQARYTYNDKNERIPVE
ncbi:MAG: hypothetical protein FD126_443 [Elusimicrobia bacterium]|nr:MAG: hypothetical protein FD126_443 [Elusimicrobiota bacterium]